MATELGEMGDMGIITRFVGEHAPCGRFADGERHRDADTQGLIFEDLEYVCGCLDSRRRGPDGRLRRTVVQHDGTVRADEPEHQR